MGGSPLSDVVAALLAAQSEYTEYSRHYTPTIPGLSEARDDILALDRRGDLVPHFPRHAPSGGGLGVV
jgi:hypothetical protein